MADAQLIRVADYPELSLLFWHRPAAPETVTEEEAFAIYERLWRYVDRNAMQPHERDLVERLTQTIGKGCFLG